MQIKDFKAEIEILAMAYPNVFPEDAQKRGAMAIIWFEHFQHIPKEMFAKSSKWCREHERFLSIASLRAAIVEVAGIPSIYDIRKQLDVRMEEDCYAMDCHRPDKKYLHPIAERIYETLSLYLNESFLKDFEFERECKRAREWWVEKIMQPENVALLTGPPLLDSGEPGGV